MTALLRELELVDAGHPRFVSPAGDSRDNRVPCRRCFHPTLALRPTVCVRCEPVSEVPPTSDAPGRFRPPAPAPAHPSRPTGVRADAHDNALVAVQDGQKPGAGRSTQPQTEDAPVAAATAPGR